MKGVNQSPCSNKIKLIDELKWLQSISELLMSLSIQSSHGISCFSGFGHCIKSSMVIRKTGLNPGNKCKSSTNV